MNGLPDWDQMSVREQTAWLKARLDMMSRRWDELHDQGSAERRRVDGLSSRISALEAAQGRTHYEGDGCAGGHYAAETIEMHKLVNALDGMRPYTVIRTNEYSRLLRIEEAARALTQQFPELEPFVDHKTNQVVRALREALKP